MQENWSDDVDPRRMNAVQRVTVSEDGTRPFAVTEFEYDDAYGTDYCRACAGEIVAFLKSRILECEGVLSEN
jgi:hypothetical protein